METANWGNIRAISPLLHAAPLSPPKYEPCKESSLESYAVLSSKLHARLRAHRVRLNHYESNIEFRISFRGGYPRDALVVGTKTTIVPKKPSSMEGGYSIINECYGDSTNHSSNRLAVISKLARILERYPQFKVYEQKEKPKKNIPDQMLDPKIWDNNRFNLLDFNKLSQSQVLSFCTESKQISVEFQAFLLITTPKIIEVISGKLDAWVELMLLDKFANYVLRKLVKLNGSIRIKSTNLLMSTFEKTISDEYSSGVLQACMEADQETVERVLYQLSMYPSLIRNSASAVSVLSTAIRVAKTESHFIFVLKQFERDPLKWLAKRQLKRSLIAFMHYASAKSLNRVHGVLFSACPPLTLLQDKYSTYVLLTLIERVHLHTIQDMKQLICDDLVALASTKYFRFFVSHLSKNNNDSEILRTICSQALRLVESENRGAGNSYLSPGVRYFLLYLLAKNLPEQVYDFCAFFGELTVQE